MRRPACALPDEKAKKRVMTFENAYSINEACIRAIDILYFTDGPKTAIDVFATRNERFM